MNEICIKAALSFSRSKILNESLIEAKALISDFSEFNRPGY